MVKSLKPVLILTLAFFCADASAQRLPADVSDQLKSPFFEKLYANTYYSILNRLGPDGFLPESVTGAYEGMYCRTTGPLAALLIETGRLKEAELNINCVLAAMQQYHMEWVPHVIGKENGTYTLISDEPQIDGQAHLIQAWARLALERGRTPFEDRTWPAICTLMNRTCDREHLGTGRWSVQTGLVRNTSFEHSREGRRWDTWDLLTQSFAGAALHDMIIIAKKRGEDKLAGYWSKRLGLLTEGIHKNLTVVRNNDTTYLEMRLPDSNGGVPYLGMGWVTLSPVAAQWEGINHRVLQNTVKAMQKSMMKTTNGFTWMPTDSYPDGTVANEVIGKGMAWEMEFARQEKDNTRLLQILKLISEINAANPIYMEGGWLDAPGYKFSQKLTDKDIAAMKDGKWKIKDAGNGEQTTWWCWAMARLRKEAGRPAAPAKP